MTENLKLVTAKTNRKPADELFDVRERIKALKERETFLRNGMLTGKLSLTGDEFKVYITKSKFKRVDTDKLKKELGLQFLRPYIKEVVIDYVKLKELKGKGVEPVDDEDDQEERGG